MATNGFFGPPPPGGWSQCGTLWALGTVALLGLASGAAARGSAGRRVRGLDEPGVAPGFDVLDQTYDVVVSDQDGDVVANFTEED